MSVINSLILIVIGLIFGIVIGRLLHRSQITDTSKLKAELKESRRELEQYRQQVSEHFENSAVLLNSFAEQYQKLYQHMAEQSEQLLDPQAISKPLFDNPANAKLSAPEANKTGEPSDPPKDYSGQSTGLLEDEPQST